MHSNEYNQQMNQVWFLKWPPGFILRNPFEFLTIKCQHILKEWSVFPITSFNDTIQKIWTKKGLFWKFLFILILHLQILNAWLCALTLLWLYDYCVKLIFAFISNWNDFCLIPIWKFNFWRWGDEKKKPLFYRRDRPIFSDLEDFFFF